jgi:hypothetical protein
MTKNARMRIGPNAQHLEAEEVARVLPKHDESIAAPTDRRDVALVVPNEVAKSVQLGGTRHGTAAAVGRVKSPSTGHGAVDGSHGMIPSIDGAVCETGNWTTHWRGVAPE